MGKPIMAYSIGAALESGLFDEVMVSTDDDEIAQVARQYGAQVPFMRSAETANDYASTADVLTEVLDRYLAEGKSFESFCCLYSTAPFVTAEKLQGAYRLMTGEVDATFTVVEYSYPIQRSLKVSRDGFVEMNFPEHRSSRSQDLEKTYHDAGQFYFVKTQAFLNERTLWCRRTAPFVLSELEVQDLDTETDWKLAEMKYRLIT